MIASTKPASFHRRALDPEDTGSDVIKPHVPQVITGRRGPETNESMNEQK